MSMLVIQIPPRPRVRSAASEEAAGPSAAAREYTFVFSRDGLSVSREGRCNASLLPKADTVIAVLADADVSWHRMALPKAPPSRLQAALLGVLEESLLDDTANTLLAVAPDATPGKPTCVAAVHLPWLQSELNLLERANLFVDRVVPVSEPDEATRGHFAEAQDWLGDAGPTTITVSWSHPAGVAVLDIEGNLARHLIARPPAPTSRWTTTPGAAQSAERWLGQPVEVLPTSLRLLEASRSSWNLRQFTLARQSRGWRAARDLLRQLLTPQWRPVRWGLGFLVLFQVLGLNLWAWKQEAEIRRRQASMNQVLKDAFPNVQAILDAPLQMQRELQALRTLAGRPGESDFEPAIQAAASAWPSDRPPVEQIQFKDGRLSLSATGWTEAQWSQFRNDISPYGWKVESSEGRAVLSRGAFTPATAGGQR